VLADRGTGAEKTRGEFWGEVKKHSTGMGNEEGERNIRQNIFGEKKKVKGSRRMLKRAGKIINQSVYKKGGERKALEDGRRE